MLKIEGVLLIDDDDATNNYHKIIIEDTGITNHLQVCNDGQEALDYLTSTGSYVGKGASYSDPELIFLDLNMPGIDGFEFLEAYHNLPTEIKSNRIIIILSTSIFKNDIDRVNKYDEVNDFLNKPLTKEALKQISEKYFKRA